MITLRTNRLRVELSEPGECPNDGFRFDRSGFISEVILDGARHFCANEPKNLSHPSTGGRGLCSELKADLSRECPAGQPYPKLGVGLIPRTGTEDFCFYQRYHGVKEFPLYISATETHATFETEPLPCFGYAIREKKEVSVHENTLTITYCVSNTGEKELTFTEYCHNFISIDGMAISPDYHLEFPKLRTFPKKPVLDYQGKPCNLIGEGHGFGFAKAMTAVSLADIDLTDFVPTIPFEWKLTHTGAKASVSGSDSLVPSGITIWACDHIVSPEIKHTITLRPGSSVDWKRSWTFDSFA